VTWVLALAYALALVVWVGETIFLSFVVAPVMFGGFAVEEAGRVMSALFPSYYRIGYVCGIVLLGTALLMQRHAGSFLPWGLAAAISGLMLAAVLYAGVVIQPAVHELRAAREDPARAAQVEPRFQALHRRSVELNGVVLLGGLLLVGITAARLH
jgi:uncharacterized membrane protein